MVFIANGRYLGKERWVEYARPDFNASQVCAEWYGPRLTVLVFLKFNVGILGYIR